MQRPSQIDAYLPFIHETLKKFPSLTASRLYAMVCERGYRGNHHHFRHLISVHRPRPITEAYLRLRTLPGEQGQVDWAHFDHLQIGRARRPLMAFVMVLSWSRQIYLRFFLDARMDSFLAGHAGAFEAWSGLPRVLLYDNLKSAVLERQGDAIRFNPQLCSRSPPIIAMSPVLWPLREATRRAVSNVQSDMYARTSLPRASSSTSTI